MKLSITVASIIALAAAAPVEVRDPQRFGSGAPSGGFQNGAQLIHDGFGDGGSTGSGAPPGEFQNGAQLIHDDFDDGGSTGSGVPLTGFQNGGGAPQGSNQGGLGPGASSGGFPTGANLGGPATGPKKDSSFTKEVCDNIARGHSQEFAKQFGCGF